MFRLALVVVLAGLTGCRSAPERPAGGPVPETPPGNSGGPASAAVPVPAPAPAPAPTAAPVAEPAAAPAAAGSSPELAAPLRIVTVQAEEPRYLPPPSLRQFRYAKPPAGQAPAPAPLAAARGAPAPEPVPAELPERRVATVDAAAEGPRYRLPESLAHWGSGRKVPLYDSPDVVPWQAEASQPRLGNAAVSCNYKDEGGVRGRAMLLVDDHQVTRFTARIEMPNGGVCVFDSKKMEQRPFEQGIALQSRGDACVVRMWEQGHRITIAAYSCHKQCSRGSFSYLWPIIMDTRVGNCY